MIYDRYYYTILTDKEKTVYKAVYHGLERFETSIKIPAQSVDICKVVNAVNLDNPHLFFVNFEECRIMESPFVKAYVPSYYFFKEQAAHLWKSVKEKVVKILTGIGQHEEYERQLAIHDRLANDILYDEAARINGKTSAYSSTVLGVFLHKKALCEGIAKATKLLMNTVNIKCIVAVGKLDCDNHAWNIVKIDGAASHLDVTNDLDSENMGVIHHTFCNLTDSQIAKTHSVLYTYPACNSGQYDYFLKNDLCVSCKTDLKRVIASAIFRGVRYAEFRLENSRISENAVMQVAMRALGRYTHLQSVKIVSYINRGQGVFVLQW